MAFFRHDRAQDNAATRRIYAAFELAYTIVDFVAALCFVVGSVMFFFERLTYAGTWFFVVGSVCFALKPTLRLLRELRMAAAGDTESLAERDRSNV